MLPALFLFASLVNDVRALVAQHDLSAAERAAASYRQQAGNTPELAAALSWIARGAFESHDLAAADRYADDARKRSIDLLRTRPLDADPWLPTALGASIEIHANVLAARGERPDAIAFLTEQLAAYGKTSIGERIRKNINLLGLEGKPAPALDGREWLGAQPPPGARRGHPVLLFFWAHWCVDCKAEAPILASLLKTYGPKGLVVWAPTRLYGFAAGGEPAAPAVEKPYIEQVFHHYYAGLTGVPVPLSAASFLAYGASTTPTLVLIDRNGIVRWYHPGAVAEPELAARIRSVLAR